MLSNFEILRKNKIVALVVMFLVIGAIVSVLDMIHGYSLFESFPKYSFETKGVKFNPFKYNLINKLINSLKIIYMKLVFYYEKIKRII